MKPKKNISTITVSNAAKFTTRQWTDSAGKNHSRVKVKDRNHTWVIESSEDGPTQLTKYSAVTHH